QRREGFLRRCDWKGTERRRYRRRQKPRIEAEADSKHGQRMIVFVNERFVVEEEATVSVFDRSFLYGDGLFETLLVANGKPFRWEQHLLRLRRGAGFLKISLPYEPK